jgi:hypothetical protein
MLLESEVAMKMLSLNCVDWTWSDHVVSFISPVEVMKTFVMSYPK